MYVNSFRTFKANNQRIVKECRGVKVTEGFPKPDFSKIVECGDILQEIQTCKYGVWTLFQNIWCKWKGRNEAVKLIQKK